MNPAAISIVVGVIWLVWHLPLFFMVGVGQYQTSVPAFFMGLMGYFFVTTALYLKTESVIPCVILCRKTPDWISSQSIPGCAPMNNIAESLKARLRNLAWKHSFTCKTD